MTTPVSRFASLDEVRTCIIDGMRIGLGGFWFVRTPMALIDEVLESGARELEIVTWSCGLGLERLIEAGRVAKVYYSINSLDVFGLAPRFRASIESGAVEPVEMTTEVMFKALQATEQNIPFLPVRGPLDSDYATDEYPLRTVRDPFSGSDFFAVPALSLDLALVHAHAADEHGNVTIPGSRGLDLRLIRAADRSMVSVEEILPAFAGPDAAIRTTVPHIFVNDVVLAPGGARPASCTPAYETDYLAIADGFAPSAGAVAKDVPSRDWMPMFRGADDREVTAAELIAATLASGLRDGGIYTVGSVTPLAMVAYQLAKRTHAPTLVTIPFGGLVDPGEYKVSLTRAESDALERATAFMGLDDFYEQLYSGGRIEGEILSPAQIDGECRMNNSRAYRPDGSVVRLPGGAGIGDVGMYHRDLMVYIARHSPERLTRRVAFLGGSRALVADDEREAAGLRAGAVMLVTDLAVMNLDPVSRGFALASVHPGVRVATVVERTGFTFEIPELVPETPLPSAEVLELIRRDVDPNGLRDLELVPSNRRLPLIRRIIAEESAEARS